MSIFINNDTMIGIDVYAWEEKGIPVFSLVEPSGAIVSSKETFNFKKPAWGETRAIMSESISLFGDGSSEINPYKLIDARIKILLREWTIKDDEGKTLPATRENIDRLPPQLITLLGNTLSNMPEFAVC